MKILILKPSSLGDVVQALPVLRLIKLHFPRSEIYWWIDSHLAPLLDDDPDLAGIIRFDRRQWAAPATWLNAWHAVRRVRDLEFDFVIDLQGLLRSGAFAWVANGKLLVGLDEPREGARGFYDIIVRRPSFHTHAVDWYLGVLPHLGVPLDQEFSWLPPRPGVAREVRRKWPVESARWIILQPGARWLNKRWPIEHFAELLRRLAQGLPEVHFAILGGQEDRALGEALARETPARCLDLTGRLSLPEMIEWIRAGELMVTNDTGPMHVAAALGKPVVGLFGPTEPRRTGPYGQVQHALQVQLSCVPCLKPRCSRAAPLECLHAIPPATVARAVYESMRNTHSQSSEKNWVLMPTPAMAEDE